MITYSHNIFCFAMLPVTSINRLQYLFILYHKTTMKCKEHSRNTSLAAKGVLAHRLQCRTACKIQNCHQGAPKWPTGSGNNLNLKLLDPPINFCKISFLIQSFLQWEPQKSKMAARGHHCLRNLYHCFHYLHSCFQYLHSCFHACIISL